MAVLAAAVMATTALVSTASAAPGGPAGGSSHAATQAAMDAQVRAGVPGVLGEARDGRAIWHGSAGVADLGTHRPRLPRDRFRIGSISKVFSSVVLLQLEAEGRIRLDDTVERRLPGVVHGNGHDGRRITIRQLLNHTSGIFNYTTDEKFLEDFGKDFFRHRFETRTPAQLVAVAMRHRPYFAPGTGWTYSNTNYVLAGMIIQKVTGHSYATEIERRVIKPLGLHATVLPGTSPRMPDPHGRAYSKLEQTAPDAKIYDVTELNPSWAGAAGEIVSTTGDLNRLYHALLGGKLLPRHQQRELLTTVPQGPGSGGARYGLGISTAKLACGVPLWFHDGGIHGSSSVVTATADGRHTAAFNLNGDWTGELLPAVTAEYCGSAGPAAASGAHPAPARPALLR